MKNFTMRWMIAALAVTATAAVASAQTYNAEIPLAFRAGLAQFDAGSYKVAMVSTSSGLPLIRFTNVNTNKQAVVMTAPGRATKSADDYSAVLTFECWGGDCMLRQISSDGIALRVPVARHAPPLAGIRIVTVSLKSR